jgi:DNA-binding XRE family transcriptional regulator
MAKLYKRSYRKNGLDFSNLAFSSKSERTYVKRSVERIADQIRARRLEMGFSQEKLAELASVSVGTIKYIELNQRAPSLPLLCKILFILDRDATIWVQS